MEHILDTMSIVKELKRGGFSQTKAEVITGVFRDHLVSNLVTKETLRVELMSLQLKLTFTNAALLGVAVGLIKFL